MENSICLHCDANNAPHADFCEKCRHFFGSDARDYRTELSQYIDVTTLDIGKQFYVCNGDWFGKIVLDKDGDKAVENNMGIHKISTSYFLEVEICTKKGNRPRKRGRKPNLGKDYYPL